MDDTSSQDPFAPLLGAGRGKRRAPTLEEIARALSPKLRGTLALCHGAPYAIACSTLCLVGREQREQLKELGVIEDDGGRPALLDLTARGIELIGYLSRRPGHRRDERAALKPHPGPLAAEVANASPRLRRALRALAGAPSQSAAGVIAALSEPEREELSRIRARTFPDFAEETVALLLSLSLGRR